MGLDFTRSEAYVAIHSSPDIFLIHKSSDCLIEADGNACDAVQKLIQFFVSLALASISIQVFSGSSTSNPSPI